MWSAEVCALGVLEFYALEEKESILDFFEGIEES
jgi:hypothetical protein